MPPTKKRSCDEITENAVALLARRKAAKAQALVASIGRKKNDNTVQDNKKITSTTPTKKKKPSTAERVIKQAKRPAVVRPGIAPRPSAVTASPTKKKTDDFLPTSSSEEENDDDDDDDDEDPPAVDVDEPVRKKRRTTGLDGGGGVNQNSLVIYEKNQPPIAAAVAPPPPPQALLEPNRQEQVVHFALAPHLPPTQVPNRRRRQQQQQQQVVAPPVVARHAHAVPFQPSPQLAPPPRKTLAHHGPAGRDVTDEDADDEAGDDLHPRHDLPEPPHYPPKKTSYFELALLVTCVLVAMVAIWFVAVTTDLHEPSFASETTAKMPTIAGNTATWLENAVVSISPPCPLGGRCFNGELYECERYLQIVDGACVLEDSATVKIHIIEKALHKYSCQHIGRTTTEDVNPLFAREEQGRPLYYLALLIKALNIPEGEADAELLAVANLLSNKDKFLLSSDGLLVGIHPRRSIPGASFARGRAISGMVARFMGSFLIASLRVYCSWLMQAPFWTLFYTLVALGVVPATYQYVIGVYRKKKKVRDVVRYRTLVYDELYLARARGPIEAEELWERVAVRAFRNDHRKRQQLKARVWKGIVKDAKHDPRIDIEKEAGGRTMWTWNDSVRPVAPALWW